jgi:hypothetical protein
MPTGFPAVLVSFAASALAIVAISDLEQGWVAIAAAALALTAVSLLLTGQRLTSVLALNAIGWAALAWSLMERTPITVAVQNDRIQARAGGELVQARDTRYPAGGVAIWMDDATVSRAAMAAPGRLGELSLVQALVAPAYDGYRPGISNISLDVDGDVRSDFGTLWQSDAKQQESLAEGSFQSISLRLDALRPSSPFSVLTRFNDGEGYQALVRPESRDLSLSRVRDGRLVQELENRGSPFRKDWIAALQSVLRELGRTWLFALLLVAAGLAISAVGGLRVGAGSAVRSDGHLARSHSVASRDSGATGTGRMPGALMPVLLAGLSLAAVAITAWITLSVFEAVPHDRDSVAYLFQARLFASGAVSAPAPSMPEFFKEDFIVQHQGRWFGKYPPGHPLVLALGLLAGVPWMVGPLLAGAAVALLGALGLRLYGPALGLAAAALLISSPFFLFMSGSYLAHPTALVLTLGGLMLGLRLMGRTTYFPHPNPLPEGEGATSLAMFGSLTPWERVEVRVPAAILLGLVLGALLGTRQLTGAALAVCLAVWLMLDPSRSVRERLTLLLAIGLGALPPLFGLLGFQYATTGSPFQSPQLLWWSFDTIGFGPGVGADGWHDAAMGLHDTWDRLTELQRHLFGWPFYLTLAPAMIPFISGRSDRRDWWLLSVTVALVLAYVLYWNRGMAYGPRYYYEALGPLCLLSVRGFQALASLAPGGRTWPAWLYGSALALALVAFNVGMYLPQQAREFRGYLGVDGRRAALVHSAGLDRGLVFVRDEPRGSWQPYASVFWLNAPTLDSPVIFARDRGADENARLHELMPDKPVYVLTQTSLTPVSERP